MTLYESMFVRKSVRNYRIEAIEDRLLNVVRAFQKYLVAYNEEIDTEYEIIDCTSDIGKVKGRFGVKAPYYLAFYSEEHEEMYINAGFLLEQFALYLQSRGIGTCYLGNVKPVNVKVDKKFVIMLAFGYPAGELCRRQDELKRWELAKLCVFKEELRKPVKILLDAARSAPSSMNSQPWRFVVYEKRIHVFLQKRKFLKRITQRWNLIDMGIMLSHLMLAADELWLDASFHKLENITNKNVPNNEYVTSVIWK